MRRIAVVSAKGGVGKTTVAANLAMALGAAGHRVLAIDLDPQNALRLHFGADPLPVGGLASCSLAGAPWSDAMWQSSSNVWCLPFGSINETGRRRFERVLDEDDHWLASQLRSLDLPQDTLVVIDTPPGASVYLRQALTHAHLALAVVLPDVASSATVAAMDDLLETYCSGRPDFIAVHYLINQNDIAFRLGEDVAAVLRWRLGKRVIGAIQRDQAVCEALGFGQGVADYAAHSRPAHDYTTLAAQLAKQLTAQGVA